jgi:hypothetical protein
MENIDDIKILQVNGLGGIGVAVHQVKVTQIKGKLPCLIKC